MDVRKLIVERGIEGALLYLADELAKLKEALGEPPANPPVDVQPAGEEVKDNG